MLKSTKHKSSDFHTERERYREKIKEKAKKAFDRGEYLVHAEYFGIKCDNEKCGWADWSVTEDQYPDYVDKPCPCCGENLLTREAFERTKTISDFYKKANDYLMSHTTKKERESLKNNSEYVSYFSPVNADGTIDFNFVPEEFEQ